jgi:hypothetical protein
MLRSIELRWFYPGTIPTATNDWFNTEASGELVGTPETREDFYLQIPECEYLGVKLRQQRLEVKLRQSELGLLRFGESLEGKAEQWVKWMCEDDAAENLLPVDVVKNKPWVKVKKVRSQRRYLNCNLELTQLNIQSNEWWSLGFETFGEDANLMEHLQTAASLVGENYRGMEMRSPDSYAYPKWLSLVNTNC